MIRRSYQYLDGATLVQLFKAIVRPTLEASNVVWSPVLKKDSDLLEGVQRRATKLVPGLEETPYEERLASLKLPSLVFRRARGDMIETYKYLYNIYKTDNSFLPRATGRSTRGHSLKLWKASCNTRRRQHFFSQRVVDPWNSLPEAVVTAPSLNAFKNRLDKHWGRIKYSLSPHFPHLRTHDHRAAGPVETS